MCAFEVKFMLQETGEIVLWVLAVTVRLFYLFSFPSFSLGMKITLNILVGFVVGPIIGQIKNISSITLLGLI